jgi:hypothetical protein
MKRFFLVLIILLNLIFFPFFALTQQQSRSLDISALIGVEEEPPPPPPSIPGVGGQPTKIVFRGRAYPNAFLTLLKNNEVASTFFAEDSGLFEDELLGLAGGTYDFIIFAEDKNGRESISLSFSLNILYGSITRVSGIFIPPTIEVNPIEVEKGNKVKIYGQGFPESEINIFISPGEIVKKTKVSLTGDWSYQLETGDLEEKKYIVTTQAFYGDGEQTQFSKTASFSILPTEALACQGTDLNFDGKIDAVDFSILLYFWNQTAPENKCADGNSDGLVDVFDFSIMMYEWTG